jgi:hypothetical protein
MPEQDGADASLEPDVDEQVEVDAEAPVETPEPESEVDSPPADDEPVEEKSDALKTRMSTLARQRREAEEQAAATEEENKRLRQQIADTPRPKPELKTLADFDHDHEAHAAYIVEQAEVRAEDAAERKIGQAQAERQQQGEKVAWKGREDTFADANDDYRKVAYADDHKVSGAIVEEIRFSDVGPEMAYFLGKNHDESDRIAVLPDALARREMMRLEIKVSAEKSKTSKDVSDAPPPPGTLRGAKAAPRISTTDPSSDKMTDKQWYAAEEKRLAKLRS